MYSKAQIKKDKNKLRTLALFYQNKLSISDSKIRLPISYLNLSRNMSAYLMIEEMKRKGIIKFDIKHLKKLILDGTANISTLEDRYNFDRYSDEHFVSLKRLKEVDILFQRETKDSWFYGISKFDDESLGNLIKDAVRYNGNPEESLRTVKHICKYMGFAQTYFKLDSTYVDNMDLQDGYFCDDCDGDIDRYRSSRFESGWLSKFVEKMNKVKIINK